MNQKMPLIGPKSGPQGLKPRSLCAPFGTTEVVPCYKASNGGFVQHCLRQNQRRCVLSSVSQSRRSLRSRRLECLGSGIQHLWFCYKAQVVLRLCDVRAKARTLRAEARTLPPPIRRRLKAAPLQCDPLAECADGIKSEERVALPPAVFPISETSCRPRSR
jgi:hypothetical protein